MGSLNLRNLGTWLLWGWPMDRSAGALGQLPEQIGWGWEGQLTVGFILKARMGCSPFFHLWGPFKWVCFVGGLQELGWQRYLLSTMGSIFVDTCLSHVCWTGMVLLNMELRFIEVKYWCLVILLFPKTRLALFIWDFEDHNIWFVTSTLVGLVQSHTHTEAVRDQTLVSPHHAPSAMGNGGLLQCCLPLGDCWAKMYGILRRTSWTSTWLCSARGYFNLGRAWDYVFFAGLKQLAGIAVLVKGICPVFCCRCLIFWRYIETIHTHTHTKDLGVHVHFLS